MRARRLQADEARLALLRPVLLLTVGVVRSGAAAVPPLEVPRSMRPFLRWATVPDRALEQVARELDASASLRRLVVDRLGEVADHVDAAPMDTATTDLEADANRAGRLFVERPDGWQQAFDELVEAAVERHRIAGRDRQLDLLRRRVDELASETKQLRAALTEVESERDRAVAAAADSDRSLDGLLAEGAVARQRIEGLESQLRKADEEGRAAHRRAAAAEAAADDARQRLEEADRLLAERAAATLRELASRAADGLRAELDRALAAQHGLADALHAVSAELTFFASQNQPEARGVTGIAPTGASAATAGDPAGRAPSDARKPRRRPHPIPAGVFEESLEAAEHLVRQPGALLLVDGYNVSLNAWPTLELRVQRDLLISALVELEARSGVRSVVVFDGDAPEPVVRGPAARSGVTTEFTATDEEADDRILAIVAGATTAGPVLVASDDRRVQDGARALGANVLVRPQLLALLRRSAHPA